MRNSLTAKRIEKLLPGKHPDGQGLYCLVAPTGGRSWALKYEPQGRERWHGLGPCHTFKPEEARQRARGVIEPALPHATGTATEPAYQRSDVIEKRRQLMQQWAAFIASPDRRGIAVTPTPINQARRS